MATFRLKSRPRGGRTSLVQRHKSRTGHAEPPLGRIAATTPASTTMMTRLSTGRLTSEMPWLFIASTSPAEEDPDQHVQDGPLQGDDHRLPPDHGA